MIICKSSPSVKNPPRNKGDINNRSEFKETITACTFKGLGAKRYRCKKLNAETYNEHL